MHHTGHADDQESCGDSCQYDIYQSVVALHIGCKDTTFFLMYDV